MCTRKRTPISANDLVELGLNFGLYVRVGCRGHYDKGDCGGSLFVEDSGREGWDY